MCKFIFFSFLISKAFDKCAMMVVKTLLYMGLRQKIIYHIGAEVCSSAGASAKFCEDMNYYVNISLVHRITPSPSHHYTITHTPHSHMHTHRKHSADQWCIGGVTAQAELPYSLAVYYLLLGHTTTTITLSTVTCPSCTFQLGENEHFPNFPRGNFITNLGCFK